MLAAQSDLAITAGQSRQIERRYGCTMTSSGFRLLSLLGSDKARSARGCLQPTRFPIPLAGNAGEMVNLLVTAGMGNALFHTGDDVRPSSRDNLKESD